MHVYIANGEVTTIVGETEEVYRAMGNAWVWSSTGV